MEKHVYKLSPADPSQPLGLPYINRRGDRQHHRHKVATACDSNGVGPNKLFVIWNHGADAAAATKPAEEKSKIGVPPRTANDGKNSNGGSSNGGDFEYFRCRLSGSSESGGDGR